MKYLSVFLVLTSCVLTSCGTRSAASDMTTVRQWRPTKPETVVIDAGHGGKDPGAISKVHDYEEKVLTLKTASIVRSYLHQLGYNTVMTRHVDTFVPLETRAEIANTLNADLFVSIHYNYASTPTVEGVEVYYYKEKRNPSSERIVQSKALGQGVLSKIVTATGAESRGLKQANFAVIRETVMPAILVEGGFLSNPKERDKLREIKYLRQLARGITAGIDEYLEKNRKAQIIR